MMTNLGIYDYKRSDVYKYGLDHVFDGNVFETHYGKDHQITKKARYCEQHISVIVEEINERCDIKNLIVNDVIPKRLIELVKGILTIQALKNVAHGLPPLKSSVLSLGSMLIEDEEDKTGKHVDISVLNYDCLLDDFRPITPHNSVERNIAVFLIKLIKEEYLMKRECFGHDHLETYKYKEGDRLSLEADDYI